MISVSYLSMDKNLISDLHNTNLDFLHVDVMDGKFVSGVSEFLELNGFKLDVHLMVKDVISYVDLYASLKPFYITFHYECGCDIIATINYIKSLNIKVGLAINPSTDVELIEPYLELLDLVLVMSVVPGAGGQKFIDKSIEKIKYLKNLNGSYLISVDGGINDTNVNLIDADIIVAGSFITNGGNYQEKIDLLRGE